MLCYAQHNIFSKSNAQKACAITNPLPNECPGPNHFLSSARQHTLYVPHDPIEEKTHHCCNTQDPMVSTEVGYKNSCTINEKQERWLPDNQPNTSQA